MLTAPKFCAHCDDWADHYTHEHHDEQKDIYKANGYKDRTDYLETLAADFDITLSDVQSIADVLGESEDFDGLISALEDYVKMSEFTQEFDDYTDADEGL